MAKLTKEKISEIIDAYNEIGTYSGAAKACGVSPATVKKYVTAGIQQDIIISMEDLFNEGALDFPRVESSENIPSPNPLPKMVITTDFTALTQEEKDAIAFFFKPGATYKGALQ